MASFEPKPFGKYFLMERLAIGGMAEIYKAKTFGVDGFEKQLAIKKILPHYSADTEFIAMLTDEAKLVVKLSHTNIVQIYDLGKVGDDYYISMEFIDGINLREVLNRGKELNKKLPLPLCLFIISEIAKGLDYAHSKRDSKGGPLGIVHRDVSPQNILISYEGETKIVDFGIAKAAMNVSQTLAGTLKGKITYMSPEQALGKPIDGRTDLYSTGIMLYEMLSGERLYKGETQFEVLKMIRTLKVDEAFLAKKIPQEIIPILTKALAYSVSDRFETAGDFQIELTKLLYSRYSDFSPKDLSQLVATWFSKEITKRKHREENEEEESLSMHTRTILERAPRESLVKGDEDETSPIYKETTKSEKEEFFPETTKPADTLRPEDFIHEPREEIPKKVTISEKKPSRKKTGFAIALLILGILFLFIFVFRKTAPPELVAIPEEEPEKVILGSLEIRSNPQGSSVLIDGEDSGETTPLKIVDLKIGNPTTIELRHEGYAPLKKTITLLDANPIVLDIQLKAIPPIPTPIAIPEPIPEPPAPELMPEPAPLPEPSEPQPEPVPPPPPEPMALPEPTPKLEPPPQPKKKAPPPTVTMTEKIPDIPQITGTGSVRIDSTPRGAAVVFDGRKAGITPVLIPNVSIGDSHSVSVARPGYAAWSNQFTLNKKYMEFNAPLKKE